MRSTIVIITAGLLGLLTLDGCKKSSDTAAPNAGDTAANGSAFDSKDADKGTVDVDPELAEMCSLPQTTFAFDSAELAPQAKATLDALAECFLTGPAQGKTMTLVGHADPRGDEEYNLGLGQRRATSVAGHLGKRGLGNDRMETSSRGELDASGTDEASWAQDRRVDIGVAR